MQVQFDRRAMIAIRSLDPTQRSRIDAVVEGLARADVGNWYEVVEARPVQVVRGDQLFSVRVDDEFRLLAKVIADALIVEDVFARERLEQIVGMAV